MRALCAAATTLYLMGYISERTNQLDLFIVVATLFEIALASTGDLKAVRSLRILRAIRPLRALTRSSGMRVVLKSVSLSVAAMVRRCRLTSG